MALFVEFALILTIATIVSIVMRLLKQPLIIGHILTGLIIVLGPIQIEQSGDVIELLSEIGIAFLLFLVGINLSPKDAKDIGPVAAITGIGQVVFTTALGFGIAIALGFSELEALYLGVALAFSSTIIIMKLLTDRGEVDSLAGRVSIGFLLVQDFIAVFTLILVTSLGGPVLTTIGTVLVKTIAIILGTIIVIRYVMPYVDRLLALSHELLFLFSITWLLALSALFTGLGFSLEIGALIAGITLSSSLHRFEISSRVRPLRDFFIVLFFILIGMQLDPNALREAFVPIMILSSFVLFGNPIVVMTLMGALGYTKRVGFRSGLTVAQISEFSLILIAAGISVGHLDASSNIMSIVAMIALITIAGSTYLIMNSDAIYKRISPVLTIFERNPKQPKKRRKRADIIIFGFNRVGYSIVESLKGKKRYLVVDFDPVIIEQLEKRKHPALFGDVYDHEFLESIDMTHIKMLISTIPDLEANLLLLERVKDTPVIRIVTAHQLNEAKELYEHGATYVLMPHFLGGEYSADLIEKHEFDIERFLELGKRHIKHLEKRRSLGHEHPKYSHVERNRRT